MPQGSQNAAQLPRYMSVELPGPGSTGGAVGHPDWEREDGLGAGAGWDAA